MVRERKTPTLIASLSIFPLGVGTSVGDFVSKAYSALKQVNGIAIEPTAMSTIIEANSLDKIWETVRRTHQAMLDAGAQRIYMVLTLDDRRDKPRTAKDKVTKMTGAAAA